MAKARLLHAMLRVANLERSLAFYREFFDLQEVRRIDLTAPTRTLVFIAPAETSAETQAREMQLELWYEPDAAQSDSVKPSNQDHASRPSSSHIGMGVSDLEGCVERLRAKGVSILQEPAALRPGGRIIALIADPDGHEIELLS